MASNAKTLIDVPAEALTRLLGYLDYPSLEMLRSTCQFLRKFPTEKQIHRIFLDMKMDELDDIVYADYDDDDFGGYCFVCPGFVGEDTDSPEDTGEWRPARASNQRR